MTTEEAIKIFESWAKCNYKQTRDAAVMAISAIRTQQEPESNQPLTLDELRQMDGEPVWVVVRDFSAEWRILECVDTKSTEKAVLFMDGSYEPLAEYGSEWLAYRHKPKEA